MKNEKFTRRDYAYWIFHRRYGKSVPSKPTIEGEKKKPLRFEVSWVPKTASKAINEAALRHKFRFSLTVVLE